MGYKELLSTSISKSGLTLREISERCKKFNVNITPSYISQLQTGKQNPPSEEVTKAISNVLNIDPTNLIIEGYIEKAPEIIKYFFSVTCTSINKILIYLKSKNVSCIDTDFQEQLKLNNILLKSDNLINYYNSLSGSSPDSLPNSSVLQYDFNESYIICERGCGDSYFQTGSILYYRPEKDYNVSDYIVFTLACDTHYKITQINYALDEDYNPTGHIIIDIAGEAELPKYQLYKPSDLNILGRIYKVKLEYNL